MSRIQKIETTHLLSKQEFLTHFRDKKEKAYALYTLRELGEKALDQKAREMEQRGRIELVGERVTEFYNVQPREDHFLGGAPYFELKMERFYCWHIHDEETDLSKSDSANNFARIIETCSSTV